MTITFHSDWRERKSAAFELAKNSTAGKTVRFDLWGRPLNVYANANLSIYSAQQCNARCTFCVEELRPASRGTGLAVQKQVEADDARYFQALEATLAGLRPLDPSVSVTGGEPSKDPRLPRILSMMQAYQARKRTVTTNGSGLLDVLDGKEVIDWVVGTGVRHLNISRAHFDQHRNRKLMRFHEAPGPAELREIVARCGSGETRLRLSCVLVSGDIDDVTGIMEYLEFARSAGVTNVIFRQLMQTDPETVEPNYIVRFSNRRRALLQPILDALGGTSGFEFQKQIVGYYYYVEVWRYRGMDVVFEEANLAQLEAVKREQPGIIHELIFHPDANLASTWQPWDGVIPR